VRAGYPNH